jgi:hypothetical protein
LKTCTASGASGKEEWFLRRALQERRRNSCRAISATVVWLQSIKPEQQIKYIKVGNFQSHLGCSIKAP